MAETSSSALRPRARSAILLCVLLGLEALTAQSTFRSTGSMNAARVYFSLTPLSSAGVLAAGGYSSDGAASATAEVFDLASESWALTGPMAQPRGFHAAVLLKNNKVLVAGGSASGSSLSSAELYDAGLGRWSPASPMFTARSGHGAYALDDGRVLVAGGGVDAAGTATAEVYNPPTNRWTPTGSMIFPRAFFSGVVLPDGRVLVAGGLGSPATSETYNPWTETWSLAGALNFPHGTGSSLTLLSNGQALILGGGGQAELFDPVTGVWTPTTPMPSTRSGHSATLLGNGLVFVTGHDPRSEPGASLVYDPLSQTWRWMAGSAPMFNLAARLIDGRVLVAGGFRTVGQSALTPTQEAFVFDDSLDGQQPVQSAESAPSTRATFALANPAVSVSAPAAAPTVSSVSPTQGPTTGSTALTVTAASLVPGGFAANLFIDMNVQDPVGTVVTSEVMSNGTIGVHDGWTVDPNAFTVGAHQIDRAGAVTVDGVVYPTSHPSKSLALDHASNFSLVHVFIPPGHRAVTVAGYITFGVPQVDSSVSQLFDYVGILGEVTGGFAVLQLNNGADGVYALSLEASEGGTHHSPNIVITPGATYWCVLKADYEGGTAYLNVLDPQQTLVGSVTTTMTTGEDVIEISMGNGEVGTASGATSYFENMVIDYTQAVFPLGPGGDPPSTAAPTLTSVAPTSGSTAGGTALTLTGTNFVPGATVTLGGSAATAVTVVSATTIRATTPAHAAGAVNVVVTNPDTQSATLANGFLYVGPTAPTITGVAPTTGSTTGGTVITITGTNLAPGATVTLGGTAVPAVTVVSATTITATTPAHAAGAVNVVVTNPDRQSVTLVNGFTYLALGPGGFAANLFVDMNVPNPVGTAVTSALMSSGTIGVHDGWTVDPNAFTVGAHQIDRAGVVTVDGVMYPTSHPSKSLALNHAYNFSMVSVGIPAGHRAVTVAGYITFGVPQVDSSSRLFDYVGIWGGVTGGYTVLQLNNGAGGVYALSLEASEGGTHHSPNIVITPGATYWCVLKADYVGGTAYLNVYDPQQTLVGAVTTTMTTGEDVNKISLGNGEIGTASGATSYFENMVIDYAQGVFPLGPGGTPPSTAAPTLTSVAPTSGSTAGGTQLTLTGTNFASGAAVSVGGIAATAVTVVSATTIRATTPAHAAGAVNVVVTNPDRQSATLANGFLYVGPTAPTITGVAPTNGSTTGGTVITITGTNLAPGATVTLGGTAVPAVTVVSATTITATTPAHAAGAVNVVVTNPDRQSVTLVNGFTYLALGPGGFAANLFVDMNVPNPVGTAVTSTIMSSGTIGVHDGWRVDPSAFTVGAHQIDRAGAVTVDGVVYPTSHPSKSLALNHASNFSTVDVLIPAGHRAVTVAGYITFGVPQVDSSSRLFDYVGIWGVATGGYAVLQLNNGAGGVYALNIEASEGGTHHSANIVITPGATYWCVLKADYIGGTAYLNVYDATQRTLVGAVTTAMTTGEDVNKISLGNGEIGTASGATSYFENMVIDYAQGAFPLGPVGTPPSQ